MDNTLRHVGILGMRWGRRKGGSSSSSNSSSDHTTSRNLKKKKLNEMSNNELRDFTTRMQLESQYRNLNPDKVTRGKKTVSKILSGIGTATVAIGTISAGYGAAKKVLDLMKKVK